MGDVLEVEHFKFLAPVTENAAQRLIDLQQMAVERNDHHPDRRELHEITEALFALDQRNFALLALGDVDAKADIL